MRKAVFLDEIDFAIDTDLLAEVLRVGEGAHRGSLPRHRHQLDREEVLTTQKARIIVATAEIVTTAGYDAASVRAITERAGVSSKTFYAIFDDKESAFLAGYSLLDGAIVQIARTGLAHGDEPRAAVRAGFGVFLETLAQWPLFTRMHTVEGRAAGARALERRTAVFRELVAALRSALQSARDVDERVTVPDDAILMAVVGGINELVLQHIVAEEIATLPELLPTVVELFERVCFSDVPAPG
jgi:AcrR family transcriptional regulator